MPDEPDTPEPETPEPDSPDSSDIDSLVRMVARAPMSIESQDAGTRWEESGWWLVPILAVFVAASFRREQKTEVAS